MSDVICQARVGRMAGSLHHLEQVMAGCVEEA